MKTLYTYALVLLASIGFAQQLPQYSQYMLNEMAINPAVAGKDDYAEVRSNNRQQWVGLTDAPRTYMLTLQGPIKDKNMGLGMNLYTDIVGPTRRTGLSLSYAYHLKLQKDLNLSFGVSAGVQQWGIDGSKIKLREEGDQQLLSSYKTTPVPDFGAGVYFHKKDKFYIGFSLPQLYRAPIGLYPDAAKNSRLASQYNVNGAYKIQVNEEFTVEPSFLFKYEKPAPAKVDVGARVIYKNEMWAGLVYRHKDAVSMLLGYMYKDYLIVGYSYDFTTTKMRNYSNGTHEIMLGLRFSRKQAATWEGKSN
ncbi:MAG: type IX secretion system membrane protein PorP/SprF [Bacteroidia bacterium]|nr:type IX secretion system membrane protein PorP/SprF [Bacteroidia bacterium]